MDLLEFFFVFFPLRERERGRGRWAMMVERMRMILF